MEFDRSLLPRCDEMDGSGLRIVPSYTEAGQFCEANCITVTDGQRTAVYVPFIDVLEGHEILPSSIPSHYRDGKLMPDGPPA